MTDEEKMDSLWRAFEKVIRNEFLDEIRRMAKSRNSVLSASAEIVLEALEDYKHKN